MHALIFIYYRLSTKISFSYSLGCLMPLGLNIASCATFVDECGGWKLCRHRAAEDARCRCCVSVSQHAHCEVIGPLERRGSVVVLVLLRTGIQASVSVIGILSDPTGSLRGALTVIVTHYPHERTCITSFLLFTFGFIILPPHGSVERRWLSTFVNVRKVWVVPHWASW